MLALDLFESWLFNYIHRLLYKLNIEHRMRVSTLVILKML